MNFLLKRKLANYLKELDQKVSKHRKGITILLAEDTIKDQILMSQAIAHSCLPNNLYIVNDGEELLDYLHHRGKYSELPRVPQPDLILLSLHLQKLDSAEAIQAIKADSNLRRIPIIVLTSSSSETDIRRCYELGASSYFTKPTTFDLLVEAVNTLEKYWFDIVELPPANTHE